VLGTAWWLVEEFALPQWRTYPRATFVTRRDIILWIHRRRLIARHVIILGLESGLSCLKLLRNDLRIPVLPFTSPEALSKGLPRRRSQLLWFIMWFPRKYTTPNFVTSVNTLIVKLSGLEFFAVCIVVRAFSFPVRRGFITITNCEALVTVDSG
jgi:hypothetical protein